MAHMAFALDINKIIHSSSHQSCHAICMQYAGFGPFLRRLSGRKTLSSTCTTTCIALVLLGKFVARGLAALNLAFRDDFLDNVVLVLCTKLSPRISLVLPRRTKNIILVWDGRHTSFSSCCFDGRSKMPCAPLPTNT